MQPARAAAAYGLAGDANLMHGETKISGVLQPGDWVRLGQAGITIFFSTKIYQRQETKLKIYRINVNLIETRNTPILLSF